MMVKALYPGSFDPVTLGHCDIIRRAAALFGGLIVAVAHNPDKTPLFTTDERLALLEAAVAGLSGVQVATYTGLTATFAQQCGAQVLVRGIRPGPDGDHEAAMAQANRQLAGLETVALFPQPAFAQLSASLVRQVAAAGYAEGFDDRILDQWVSPAVKALLRKKYEK